jgi:DNA-binding NarL/FixJ family response regulator
VNVTIVRLTTFDRMKYPICISVFEDNNSLRQSLVQLFSSETDFILRGAYPDCVSVATHVAEVLPDVILMDIDMPGRSGIEGLKLALEVAPETIVVMFTVFDDDQNVFEALKNGARGYILKKTSNEKLIAALKDIYEGGAFMSPAIAKKVLATLQPVRKTPLVTFPLTPREAGILKLLVDGYSYKMIAAAEGISIDTVRSHIKKIYEKLHVNSNVEAVKKATEHNLI